MEQDEFIAIFGVWEEARPYLHLMVNQAEMDLVVAIGDQAVTIDEAAALLGIGHAEAAALLSRCYSRCIVNKSVTDGVVRYSTASFGDLVDYFARYENWDNIPAGDRKRINRRFLDEFIARHRPNVERKAQGLSPGNALPNDTVMLLSEIEEMLDHATHIVVQPCDCRRLGQNCERPTETCVWLDQGALEALERGHGRRLTRQEAKDLVRQADKKGLMHTADSQWRTRGLHAICNCCACDCYPFLAAQELGSQGVWPKSRYVAVHDPGACNLCGACVKRCHFGAFYHDGPGHEIEGKTRANVLFNPDKCWGCGLCANTCPAGAIVMERLE
ncbi:MAG: 4Fe-4S binding protein [Anaerolineae bacterium]